MTMEVVFARVRENVVRVKDLIERALPMLP